MISSDKIEKTIDGFEIKAYYVENNDFLLKNYFEKQNRYLFSKNSFGTKLPRYLKMLFATS